MPASKNTRYHEAAHAVTAHILGIDMRDEGIVLRSDHEAWVAMSENVPRDADEDWFIRRVAVKLAGSLGLCRLRNEPLEWDTLRLTAEYHNDFEDALGILRDFWCRSGYAGENPIENRIDQQMQRSARLAMDCIITNEAIIREIVDASDGKDGFRREDVVRTAQNFGK
jgi:hypothetical protein